MAHRCTDFRFTCGVCHGTGTIPAEGISAATTAPEDRETRECYQCEGTGQVCAKHGRGATA